MDRDRRCPLRCCCQSLIDPSPTARAEALSLAVSMNRSRPTAVTNLRRRHTVSGERPLFSISRKYATPVAMTMLSSCTALAPALACGQGRDGDGTHSKHESSSSRGLGHQDRRLRRDTWRACHRRRGHRVGRCRSRRRDLHSRCRGVGVEAMRRAASACAAPPSLEVNRRTICSLLEESKSTCCQFPPVAAAAIDPDPERVGAVVHCFDDPPDRSFWGHGDRPDRRPLPSCDALRFFPHVEGNIFSGVKGFDHQALAGVVTSSEDSARPLNDFFRCLLPILE